MMASEEGPLFEFISHLDDIDDELRAYKSPSERDAEQVSAARRAARDDLPKPLTIEERGALMRELDDLLLGRHYGYVDAGTEARIRHIMRRLR